MNWLIFHGLFFLFSNYACKFHPHSCAVIVQFLALYTTPLPVNIHIQLLYCQWHSYFFQVLPIIILLLIFLSFTLVKACICFLWMHVHPHIYTQFLLYTKVQLGGIRTVSSPCRFSGNLWLFYQLSENSAVWESVSNTQKFQLTQYCSKLGL